MNATANVFPPCTHICNYANAAKSVSKNKKPSSSRNATQGYKNRIVFLITSTQYEKRASTYSHVFRMRCLEATQGFGCKIRDYFVDVLRFKIRGLLNNL